MFDVLTFNFQYENEMRKKSVWSPSTSRTWPHYSDVSGSVRKIYVN